MNEIARSSYYYKPHQAAGKLDDSELKSRIEVVVERCANYGYRRVCHKLRRQGLIVNHKRVSRVMREHGLGVRVKKPFMSKAKDDQRETVRFFKNRYQNVVPEGINQVWVADITYVRLAQDFCYLAVVLDACSRKVVGYALSSRPDTLLAIAALNAAVRSRSPPPGCIHHSDR